MQRRGCLESYSTGKIDRIRTFGSSASRGICVCEEAVKELKLQPDQYVHSQRLREWAWRNRNSKFVPESLLEAWGFETDQFL
jgi:hypothetical protein